MCVCVCVCDNWDSVCVCVCVCVRETTGTGFIIFSKIDKIPSSSKSFPVSISRALTLSLSIRPYYQLLLRCFPFSIHMKLM